MMHQILWMSPISALLLPGLAGFLTAFLFTHQTKIRFRLLFLISTAFPLGFGLSSLLLFWSYETAGAHAKSATIISMIVLCLALLVVSIFQLVRSRKINEAISAPPKSGKQSKVTILLTVAALCIFGFYLFNFLDFLLTRLTWNPVGGWDARYMWNLKAKFLFRSTEHWRDMFSPLIVVWSLPDYPLMLPASVAWGWNWVGREVLIWPGLVNLTFFLSMILLVIWYIASTSHVWYGLLAGAFLVSLSALQTWTAALYADIPLAFLFTAALITLIQALRSESKRLLLLSAFLAGLAAWTKNEGIVFNVWLALFCLLAILSRKLDHKTKGRFIACYLAGLTAPLLTTFYLKITYGGFGVYLQSSRSPQDYLRILTDWPRTQYILASFAAFMINFSLWKSLWILFFAGLILLPFLKLHSRQNPFFWMLPAMVLLISASYIFIFQITPIELRSHIQWSLSRLLAHQGAIALLFSFEVFYMFRGNQAN